MENKKQEERKFLAKCAGDCKQKTVHSIYGISRKRGIRLMCDICKSKLKRYTNIKNLQSNDITKQEENQ